MDSPPDAEAILAILRERDIPVKLDALESALDNGADSTDSEWLSRHLRPETLLSREELILHTRLEASGALQPLVRDPSLGATRPLLEDEIRDAIKSLEASTTTVQQQSRILSLQCETIKKQLRSRENLKQDQTRDIARLRKKHEAEKQNTASLANDLSGELDAKFKTENDNATAGSKRILSALSTRLKRDDKVLANMESTISETKSSGNDASTVKRATYLSEALAEYSAQEIHYRLDRLYLKGIQDEDVNHSQGTGNETVGSLEDELESLYPEIEILAQMATKQQFLEPILREIHEQHSHLRAASQLKLEHILDLLVDLTLSKQALTTQLSARESSCELLEQITSLYQAETASYLVAQPSSRRESLRRRSLQPGMLLGTNRPSSVGPEQPALENILRRIGVSADSVLRPRAEDGGVPGLYDKRTQMSETLQHLGMTAESPLISHLIHSDQAAQLLRSSLHGNSRVETSLRDPGQESALSDLETTLASLQSGVHGLDLDVLHQRDKGQARFFERWG